MPDGVITSSPVAVPNPRQVLTHRLWKNSVAVLCGVFAFFIVYVVLLDGPFTMGSLGKAVAGTASIGLAISFVLSTVGYYFDILDNKIIYRKYFGLLGYYLSLVYGAFLLCLQPNFYFFGFFKNFWTPDISLGFFSLAIFTCMACISRDQVMLRMGPPLWRNCLRLGYVAYFLLVVRAVTVEGDLWGPWFSEPSTLPRVRFLLGFIALVILFFRVSMLFSQSRKPVESIPASSV